MNEPKLVHTTTVKLVLPPHVHRAIRKEGLDIATAKNFRLWREQDPSGVILEFEMEKTL